jgi:hypothetical protein
MEPLNLKDDRIRILCEHNDDVYELYMGQGMKRRFTDETLPDEIKTALGFINSFDWDELHRSNTMGNGHPNVTLKPWLHHTDDDYLEILWTYKNYCPDILREIGWRVRDRYAITLPMEVFLTIKGEPQS